MKIYVVMGSTGEYSDRREWSVCAYTDEAKAKRHADLAAERALVLKKAGWRNHWLDKGPNPAGSNEYDPVMDMDYTGTDYYHMEVEVRDELPEATCHAPTETASR